MYYHEKAIRRSTRICWTAVVINYTLLLWTLSRIGIQPNWVTAICAVINLAGVYWPLRTHYRMARRVRTAAALLVLTRNQSAYNNGEFEDT